MSIDHWMTFSTFAEQEHFKYPHHDVYQGVVINGNMAAHAPAGLAAFLLGKTGQGTTYIIDPLTHAFQHDPRYISNTEGEPKTSIQRLAIEFGSPVDELIGRKPIFPEDLANRNILEGFVERCVDFQKNQIKRYMLESDLVKYLDDIDAELSPYAVVAPYFFLTETTLDQWLPINVEAARIAAANHPASDPKVFASVVVSQGIISNTEAQDWICSELSNIPLAGYLLWVDELDERTASGVELRGLLRFGKKLRGDEGREVINLHGGYFSVLAAGALGDSALTGVAHGPEFGESRGVVPVGGGIPISRYYVPELHSRIRYREAVSMFRANGWLDSADRFHSEVCDCAECIQTLAGDSENFALFGEGNVRSVKRRHGLVRLEFPTTESKKRCLKHYLQRKHREFLAASDAPKEVLVSNLEVGEQKFLQTVGLEGIGHLTLWRQILTENT